MGVILKFPCEDSRLIDVEITRDLEMIFHDYDIDYDLSMIEFGEEPSFCAEALMVWRNDPMTFICESGLIPIQKLGIVICRLAENGIGLVQEHADFICYKNALSLIRACESAFRSKKALLNRVYHRRQDLTQCWNRCITKRRVSSKPMPTYSETAIVSIAEQCADFIFSFWKHKETIGGYEKPPREPCDIADAISKAISTVTYKGEHREFKKYFDIVSSGMGMPMDLWDEIIRINVEQARLSVEILETL